MPVVLRLNRNLAETVRATLISQMKSLVDVNSQNCETRNEDDSEQDFFKVQFNVVFELKNLNFLLKILHYFFQFFLSQLM